MPGRVVVNGRPGTMPGPEGKEKTRLLGDGTPLGWGE